MSGTASPLRDRAFRGYWLAGACTNFGWNVQIVAASWMMTLLGGSAAMVALVQSFVSLPLLLFSLLAGALADVYGRRQVVLWSQGVLVAASAALVLAAGLGLMQPWALLSFTFLIGTCRAFGLPAWQTYISEIVAREDLPRAVALNVVGFNIGRSLGPAVGGMVVAVFGVISAFVLHFLTTFGMMLSVLRWRRSVVQNGLPAEGVGAAVMAGLRYVALSHVQKRILIRAFAFSFSASAMMSLMPVVVSDLLAGDATDYGLLFGAFGFGAVAAASGAATFRRTFRREAQAHIGFALFAAAMGLTAISATLPLAMLAAALGGAAWLLVQAGLSADAQMASPQWVVSRCQAILHSVLFGSLALGSWIWGGLAASFGVTLAMAAAALLLAASSLIGLVLPLLDFDAQGLEPQSESQSRTQSPLPQPAIAFPADSGPVVTRISYRIAPADRAAFLELMELRRRQRGRDGAQGWRLGQSLHDADQWSETFSLPNWHEVQRHGQRLTHFGADIDARLRALHCNGAGPIIQYEFVRNYNGRFRMPAETRPADLQPH